MKYKLLVIKLILALSLQGQSLFMDTQFADSGLMAIDGYKFTGLQTDSAGGLYASAYKVTGSPPFIYKFTVLKIAPTGQLDNSFGVNGSLLYPYDSISSAYFKGDTMYFTHCSGGQYKLYTYNLTTNAAVDSFDINNAYTIMQYGSPTILSIDNQNVILKITFPLGINALWVGDVTIKITNNQLNTNFGNNGILSVYSAYDSVSVKNVHIDSDKNLYYYGFYIDNDDYNNIIVKADSTGQIVQTFGQNGIYIINDFVGDSYTINKVKTDSLNNVYCVGFYSNIDSLGGYVYKMDENGLPINSFGSNGISRFNSLPTDTNYYDIRDLAFLTSGKILLSGFINLDAYGFKPIIKELNSNGTENTTFTCNIINTDSVIHNPGSLAIVGNDVYAINLLLPNSLTYHRILKLNYDVNHTSVESNSIEAEILLFPNPAQYGSFTIKAFDKISAIQLINSTGQVCYSGNKNSNAISLNIEGLSKGMYFVRMIINGRYYTQKLIVTE